jgi:hypothetical protein
MYKALCLPGLCLHLYVGGLDQVSTPLPQPDIRYIYSYRTEIKPGINKHSDTRIKNKKKSNYIDRWRVFSCAVGFQCPCREIYNFPLVLLVNYPILIYPLGVQAV